MSLAPERISIKRRRQEEPVETLYLEHGAAPDRKKRVTDFYFRRVQEHVIAPLSQQVQRAPLDARSTSSGIPSVRPSHPGDDVRDYAKLLDSVRMKKQGSADCESGELPQKENEAVRASADLPSNAPKHAADNNLSIPRRFHLTRQLASISTAAVSSEIRRKMLDIRPPLATFVERQRPKFKHEKSSIHARTPVDRLVDVQPAQGDPSGAAREQRIPTVDELRTSDRVATNAFVMAEDQSDKRGTSIQDHPSTWDHNSDQLADELAALAMEMDLEVEEKSKHLEANVVKAQQLAAPAPQSDKMILDDDDFVYETYVRVLPGDDERTIIDLDQLDTRVGVLVIDEEDQDLWDKYLDSDHDDDWDEEDSNAEDNPANDYPDDEVSSDDEFARNPYKYRHYDSDQEYDNDYHD